MTKVRSASLTLAALPRFELHLPTDPQFLTTELTHDDDHRIVAVGSGELHADGAPARRTAEADMMERSRVALDRAKPEVTWSPLDVNQV